MSYVLKFSLAAWMLGITFGIVNLWQYEFTPGAPSSAPEYWPDNNLISAIKVKPTLVMALHPQCGCSKASLKELTALIKKFSDQISYKILFLLPKSRDESWVQTDLWKLASELPNVEVKADYNGIVSKQFGATTSGFVTFYGTKNDLIFSGGLTSSRGHGGTSSAMKSISEYLESKPVVVKQTNTFGCALYNRTI